MVRLSQVQEARTVFRVMASLAVPDIVSQSGEVTVRELGTLTLVCTVRGM